MKVLIIKTSSMGDVIHTLPALTDAADMYPDIHFDWVVEESFAEIPCWHSRVEKVIPITLRRWRKNILRTWLQGEWRDCKHELAADRYDAVIDAQCLLKSALITRFTRGKKYGLDKHSAREPLASWFYDQAIQVAKDQHAVERIRQLFAEALGYVAPTTPGRYGIEQTSFTNDHNDTSQHMVFLHGTSRAEKCWPQSCWQELAQSVTQRGIKVFLPWGDSVEKRRAEAIAAVSQNVCVLPRVSLTEIASLLRGAVAAVTVDTGLGHLAAALDVPAVALYGPTSPELVGTYGARQHHIVAQDQATSAEGTRGDMAQISAETVLNHLKALIPDKQ